MFRESGPKDRRADSMIEGGGGVTMEALAERGKEKKRETISLMEDFPPSLNLIRKLIKLSVSKVALSLFRSLWMFVCLP